ncbi:hypothetical protein QGN32_07335 [Mycolicibacterium sp. ND9-15]|uniref:hypothetical protein n=1 Tax=Mycolicibacterium sp. ND9-15 TaxID=3042320 RepID=UPI002DD94B0E|nr:hypothetical protein [Mycolicibacterium sp. ND9-15]WSE57676.1 hypothetical protein QGN32_07335 [Mycolicibacterium sp. ND9-15]
MLREFDAILGSGSLLFHSGASHRADRRHPRLEGADDAAAQPAQRRARRRGRALRVVDGVGHDLPEPVWRPVLEVLVEDFATSAPRE